MLFVTVFCLIGLHFGSVSAKLALRNLEAPAKAQPVNNRYRDLQVSMNRLRVRDAVKRQNGCPA
jgi:hypothetical protein